MTLEELAEGVAAGLGMTITGREPGKVTLEGRNATMAITPFFGGWQLDVNLPGEPVQQFFEEDIRYLITRVDARLRAWVRKQEELARRQKKR